MTGGIRPTARNLAHMAEQVPAVPHQWGVIGISREQWTLIAAALALGGNVRVGLEDNFYLPDGEMARSNGDLIAKARQIAENAGRRVAKLARVHDQDRLWAELRQVRRVLDLGQPVTPEAASVVTAIMVDSTPKSMLRANMPGMRNSR